RAAMRRRAPHSRRRAGGNEVRSIASGFAGGKEEGRGESRALAPPVSSGRGRRRPCAGDQAGLVMILRPAEGAGHNPTPAAKVSPPSFPSRAGQFGRLLLRFSEAYYVRPRAPSWRVTPCRARLAGPASR